MTISLPIDPDANELLSRDPLALLIGMLLDQQVPLEKAFSGPRDLVRRFGHEPTAQELADYDPDALAAVFSERPALHRYPRAMAARTQDLARLIVDRYDGEPGAAVDHRGHRPGTGPPDRRATRVRRDQGADLRGPAGQAAWGPAARLAGGHRPVRPGRLPGLGGRHHRPRIPRRGPRLQAAAQSRRESRPLMAGTAQVFVLHEGYAREEDDADRVGSTVTLIVDGGRVIVVDPGMVSGRDALLGALAARGRPRPR